MCLTRKSKEFVVDYVKNTAVSTVDRAKNPNCFALVVS
jgi:hypothetical protein